LFLARPFRVVLSLRKVLSYNREEGAEIEATLGQRSTHKSEEPMEWDEDDEWSLFYSDDVDVEEDEGGREEATSSELYIHIWQSRAG